MPMTRQEFAATVERLTAVARSSPGTYKLRVLLLALLSYVFIGTLLLLTLAALALLVVWLVAGAGRVFAIKLAIPVLLILFVLLRALWVRIAPPEGRRLKRRDAPAVWAMVDELREKLRTRPVHVILLTEDFNAAMGQVPRLGMFGWQRNYLILGLPLMLMFTTGELRAVVAHELGHLSHNHSRFATWIYRIRQMWTSVVVQMTQSQAWGAGPIRAFFGWYSPLFNAYTFVLARLEEYEADRSSVAVAGAATAAAALRKSAVGARFLEEEFWPAIGKQVETSHEPPGELVGQIPLRLRSLSPDTARKWLSDAGRLVTDVSDSHPALSDRLRAIGVPFDSLEGGDSDDTPLRFPRSGQSAADELLGELLPVAMREFDARWRQGVGEAWRLQHEQNRELREKLTQLEARSDLTMQERFERAVLVSHLGDDLAAEKLLREIVATDPNHDGANFRLGMAWLARDDETGVERIQSVMRRDPDAVSAGCEQIVGFLKRNGRNAEAIAYEERWDQQQELEAEAIHERSNITTRDTFLPHDLPSDVVALVVAAVPADVRVKEMYLVRKLVERMPHRPCYVLAVKLRYRAFVVSTAGYAQQAIDRLVQTLPTPDGTIFIAIGNESRPLRRRIRKVQGSRIL